MQAGQKVIHRQRPELGIGIIQSLDSRDICDVQFERARFSHIAVQQLAPAQALASGAATVPASIRGLSPQDQLHNAMQRYRMPVLWHITSRDNVPSMVRHGLLSRHLMYRHGLPLTDISDRVVQERRAGRHGCLPHSLHDYVPLYLRARNPMLFCRRRYNQALCLVAIDPAVMLDSEFAITDGNAASWGTRFYGRLSDLRLLDWEALNCEYWNSVVDGKRKRCAEVLIHERVAPGYITGVYAASQESCQLLQEQGIAAQHAPEKFF